MKTVSQNPLLAQVEIMSRQEAYATLPVRWMDLQKFSLTTGGFEEIMHETAAAFVEFMPGMLRELKMAVDGKDADATGKILHKLKSSVSLLCTDAMTAEVVALERGATQVNSVDFVIRINKLILCVHHLVMEVLQFTRS
jgi:HPt (histidine-containing phosphotransfer) domain-containing protein